VFSFKDGKLAPLCEEKHVSFWRTFSGEMLVRIKGAESPTRLDSSDKLTFLSIYLIRLSANTPSTY